MKKILALLLALVMLLSLTACGGEKNPAEEPADDEPAASDTEDPAPAEEEEDALPSHEFDYDMGVGLVAISGAEMAVDGDGNSFLRVYYDYTNTSDSAENQDPDYCVQFIKAEQDGHEVEEFYLGYGDSAEIPEDNDTTMSIQPGITVRRSELFEIDPEGGIVSLTITLIQGSWMYTEDQLDTFVVELDPADLPGAPAEALPEPLIEDPTYVEGWDTEGQEDNEYTGYRVALHEEYDVFEYDEEYYVRVYMTYTNTGSEVWSPALTLPINAYQDGISLELEDTYFMDDECIVETDAPFMEDAETGEEIECSAVFALKTMSPVEVAIENSDYDVYVGACYDVAGKLEAQQQAAEEATSAAIEALVGSWSYDDDGWLTVYTFDADGYGTLDLWGTAYPFSYEVEGDMVYISYDDGDEEEFSVAFEGDTMIATDIFGDPTVYQAE